jgi:hypothetical protein
VPGTGQNLFLCPFCRRFVDSGRFTELVSPVIRGKVRLFGGYKGIRVIPVGMTPDMYDRVQSAIEEKLVWLLEQFGVDLIVDSSGVELPVYSEVQVYPQLSPSSITVCPEVILNV